MPSLSEDLIHTDRTERRQLMYLFTAKHHGASGSDAATWLPELSLAEEFSVFDMADLHDLSSSDGSLYGIMRDEDDGLRYLGTWRQQVAEFPAATIDGPWHGYPLYPLKDMGPENRRGEKCRPAKDVFKKMEQEGVISARQKKRLMKGDHVERRDA
jgi:hypothetical protein